MAETDKPVSVTRTTPQLITPLLLASSPHIATPVATRKLMCNVLIALAPVTIFGIVIFGLSRHGGRDYMETTRSTTSALLVISPS